MSDQYLSKIQAAFLDYLNKISQPKILEFGVRHGVSTKMFLDVCEKKDGHLYSVDVDDYSNKFISDKWTFIHSRDDNFKIIEKIIPNKVDIIFLDSFHNASHVEKIFYHYYPILKNQGIFVIDDISWIIYSKNKKRDNFNSEINNYETFFKILNIYNANEDNFKLSFDFIGSGIAKITKLNDKKLNFKKKIIIRKNSFKNFIRKIFIFFKII
ncbi:MAG: hypothetical protein CMA12_08450 [Euryarchaeota archaeon]|nr:hypothetical protein [Euryarchaeota archaeon]